jgi:PAB-dependent poly(A)-specific ribonuclease subunit 2
MNFTSKGTREILVAGCQDKMFKVDVEKGTIVETVSGRFSNNDGLC